MSELTPGGIHYLEDDEEVTFSTPPDIQSQYTEWLRTELLALAPDCRVVVLTGYSSIATAVEAIKLGAVNYLCKPADADEILASLERDTGDPDIDIADSPPSINRVTWEHIQKVLQEHDGNISATARALGMHRRTLQRKLQKRLVRH